MEEGKWCHVIREHVEFLTAAERERYRGEGYQIEEFGRREVSVACSFTAENTFVEHLPQDMPNEDMLRICKAEAERQCGNNSCITKLTVKISHSDGTLEPITEEYE